MATSTSPITPFVLADEVDADGPEAVPYLLAGVRLLEVAAAQAFVAFEQHCPAVEASGKQSAVVTATSWATPFHAYEPVTIPLPQYAYALMHFTGYGTAGMRLGLGLLARYCRCTGRAVTSLNAHRLLAVSMQVAVKANGDPFAKNAHAARHAGIGLDEFNALEVELLEAIGFRAILSPEEAAGVSAALVDLAQRRAEILNQAPPTDRAAASALCFAVDATRQQPQSAFSLIKGVFDSYGVDTATAQPPPFAPHRGALHTQHSVSPIVAARRSGSAAECEVGDEANQCEGLRSCARSSMSSSDDFFIAGLSAPSSSASGSAPVAPGTSCPTFIALGSPAVSQSTAA